jgi:hypothetical protein
MRFDTARAADLITTFGFDRTSRTGGDRKAAELLSGLLENAGCRVTRAEVFGDPLKRGLKIVLPCLGFWAGLVGAAFCGLVLSPSSVAVRVGLLAAGLTWLVAAPRALRRWHGGSGLRTRSENVVAQRPCSDAPVRAIFLTSLDPPPPAASARWRRYARRCFVASSLAIAAVSLGDWTQAPARTRWAIFGLSVTISGVALVSGWVGRLRPGHGVGTADNRDGLAALAELARAWPARWDGRIEALFAATGGTRELSGLTALITEIQAMSPPKPTLFVGFWSPGLGPPFGLFGNNLEPLEAVETAAEGLRIPFQMVWEIDHLWPEGVKYPHIAGVIGLPPSRKDAAIRPASLHHVAQLATETAFRWARREAEEMAGQEALAREARSSQNPG